LPGGRRRRGPPVHSSLRYSACPGHPCGEVAVLLVSEVFGNSVRHSGSGAPGETVTVAVIAGGTALSGSRSPIAPGRGRRSCARRAVMRKAAGGLQLVAGLAARWGGRIVTWFECALEAPDCIPGLAGRNLEDIPGSMAYPELKSNGDSSIPLKPAPSHPRRFPRSPRPFQDHYVSPRMMKGRSMERPAHRVASVMSVRPAMRSAPMARFLSVAIALGPERVLTWDLSSW
jgi:hypothetical protein